MIAKSILPLIILSIISTWLPSICVTFTLSLVSIYFFLKEGAITGANVVRHPRFIFPTLLLVKLLAILYKSLDWLIIFCAASENSLPDFVSSKPDACFLINNFIENSFSNCPIADEIDGEEIFI